MPYKCHVGADLGAVAGVLITAVFDDTLLVTATRTGGPTPTVGTSTPGHCVIGGNSAL